MTITRFSFPTTIHFGPGARRLVAAHLLEQGIRRPLIVTDRALAKLPVLAEYLLPLVKLGGQAIAQKGAGAPEEAQAAAAAVSKLGGRLAQTRPVALPGLADARYLVVYDKVAATPPAYPRRVGVPAKTPLAEQIRNGIGNAIESGVLASGARLPSWQDLAAQLGVARGTVRSAYEKLSAAQLIVSSRATGTHVSDRPAATARLDQATDRGSFREMYQGLTAHPGIFRMGVPARETFPAKLFARIRSHVVRAESSAAPMYPDPRREPALRREIAAYLAIARGIECPPSQIVVGWSGIRLSAPYSV